MYRTDSIVRRIPYIQYSYVPTELSNGKRKYFTVRFGFVILSLRQVTRVLCNAEYHVSSGKHDMHHRHHHHLDISSPLDTSCESVAIKRGFKI
jgi:hypothetical protein